LNEEIIKIEKILEVGTNNYGLKHFKVGKRQTIWELDIYPLSLTIVRVKRLYWSLKIDIAGVFLQFGLSLTR